LSVALKYLDVKIKSTLLEKQLERLEHVVRAGLLRMGISRRFGVTEKTAAKTGACLRTTFAQSVLASSCHWIALVDRILAMC
jgi:hypothetical protein